ncbi:tRNA (guanine(26)-N(2))-dimethyltransferase [Smittium culicis]|uniref:tRNA (guanine(26)-N(2))-dimethyltransferase n=1 Tax=Smittium culicis TaxID=133412 RepID=A0A1R1XND2_9FUNG|nr:tRNA (guanine(26)-N(2))-dimethyltransferase [Smittium culicis]
MDAIESNSEAVCAPVSEQFKLEDRYNVVTEGQAKVLMPKENEVFYNPIQQFNRDMSIQAINSWRLMYNQEKLEKIKRKTKNPDAVLPENQSKIKILEALAASGLRSLRYAKEIEGVDYILANDLSEEAVESIKRNAEYNDIPESILKTNQGDAIDVLYSHRPVEKQFDVIDLDPYGSAAPFIDAAVQAVKSGGLLCVTCTDMAVLASNNHPETSYAKYGGVAIRSEFCHELALRLLIHSIQSSATRYQRHVVPLISCSIDFYIRIFIRVFDSPNKAKDSIVNNGLVFNCYGCSSFYTQPFGVKSLTSSKNFKYSSSHGPVVGTNCPTCNTKLTVGGPCWISSIQNSEFANTMYEAVKANPTKFFTNKRMMGMLKVISEELDVPFHYTLNELCSAAKTSCPPILKITSAILHLGFKVSIAHSCQCSIKTNAPNEIIWDIIRAYVATVGRSKKIEDNSVAFNILKVSPRDDIKFDIHPDANPDSRKIKLVRFQINPEKFWGPKARHKSSGPQKRKL